jgi:hypothetical protein
MTVLLLTGAVSIAAVTATAIGLIASMADLRRPVTIALIAAGLGGCALVLALSLADLVPSWAVTLAGCGVIIGAQAVAVRLYRVRSLGDYAAMERTDPDADPPWWPEFESELRRTTQHHRSRRGNA